MATKSQADQLAARLHDIRERAANLRKELECLDQQERRLGVALEVLAEEFGGSASVATNTRGAAPPDERTKEHRGSVEQMLLERVFAQRDGLTSGEVVRMIAPHMTVNYGTVITTLSRMVAKGLLRKDGKRFFLAQKGRKP